MSGGNITNNVFLRPKDSAGVLVRTWFTSSVSITNNILGPNLSRGAPWSSLVEKLRYLKYGRVLFAVLGASVLEYTRPCVEVSGFPRSNGWCVLKWWGLYWVSCWLPGH